MTVEQFETISLYVCVGGLILYMFYIMYRLAKDSKAGKMGTIAIFGTLGFGVIGFVVKEILTVVLDI
ncbi:hypothetical protein A9Q99_09695 [Gammaproteobacteria bacterium 45_16_T64]|nr:hypothetical protein A9Q99_09695 [Gammaproteobacteria bacterium 45_16_T64]